MASDAVGREANVELRRRACTRAWRGCPDRRRRPGPRARACERIDAAAPWVEHDEPYGPACVAVAQPPATAGMIDTVSPSGTGVSRPPGSGRRRRRRRRSRSGAGRPRRRGGARRSRGAAASSAARTSPTVAPSTATSAAPPVRVRRVVGTRTVTLIGAAPRGSWWVTDGSGPRTVADHSHRRCGAARRDPKR